MAACRRKLAQERGFLPIPASPANLRSSLSRSSPGALRIERVPPIERTTSASDRSRSSPVTLRRVCVGWSVLIATASKWTPSRLGSRPLCEAARVDEAHRGEIPRGARRLNRVVAARNMGSAADAARPEHSYRRPKRGSRANEGGSSCTWIRRRRTFAESSWTAPAVMRVRTELCRPWSSATADEGVTWDALVRKRRRARRRSASTRRRRPKRIRKTASETTFDRAHHAGPGPRSTSTTREDTIMTTPHFRPQQR